MLNMNKRTYLVWLVLFGAAIAAYVPVQAELSNPPAASSTAQAAGADLNRMANDGHFDQLLASLEASPESAQDPKVASLEQGIKSFEQHREKADHEQAAAFAKAVARMEEQIKAGELESALVSAIDAHDLSTDPPAFLKDPRVTTLVKQANAAITAAQSSGDWIAVLSLYRVLDLLYEDYGIYHEQLKSANRHVRVMRFYDPARF